MDLAGLMAQLKAGFCFMSLAIKLTSEGERPSENEEVLKDNSPYVEILNSAEWTYEIFVRRKIGDDTNLRWTGQSGASDRN